MSPLTKGQSDTTYFVKDISATGQDMENFLFSLGCYPGEEITIISKLGNTLIINLKDTRYSINHELADAILV